MMKYLLMCWVLLVCSRSANAITVALAEDAGFTLPAIKAVVQKAGITADYQLLPQARGILLLEHKHDVWFLFSTAALNKVQPNLKIIPLPLYEVNYVAVSTRPEISIRSINDLNRHNIGWMRQNLGLQALLGNIHPKSVQYTVDHRQLLKMLKAGRFEVALMPDILVTPLSKELRMPRLFVHHLSGLRVPLYAAVRHDCSCYEPLSKALKQAVNSGEWAHAIQREIARLNTGP